MYLTRQLRHDPAKGGMITSDDRETDDGRCVGSQERSLEALWACLIVDQDVGDELAEPRAAERGCLREGEVDEVLESAMPGHRADAASRLPSRCGRDRATVIPAGRRTFRRPARATLRP